MKTAFATLTALALVSASTQTATAGDREWATAGKILTGVVAGAVISKALEAPPVYHQTTVTYVTPAPQVVYVPAPPPVVVVRPAPVVAPAPVIVPAPVVVSPAPVYVTPAPVCVVPVRRYHAPRHRAGIHIGFHHHHHTHRIYR